MMNAAETYGSTISIKVCIATTTGTPAMSIARGDSLPITHTITDADGNAVDGANLELGKWYTITWVTDGSSQYQLRPFLGSAVNGTFYIMDITVTPAA